MALGAKQRQPFSDFISQCQVLEMSFPAIPPHHLLETRSSPLTSSARFFRAQSCLYKVLAWWVHQNLRSKIRVPEGATAWGSCR